MYLQNNSWVVEEAIKKFYDEHLLNFENLTRKSRETAVKEIRKMEHSVSDKLNKNFSKIADFLLDEEPNFQNKIVGYQALNWTAIGNDIEVLKTALKIWDGSFVDCY